jgi:hypothetical protein
MEYLDDMFDQFSQAFLGDMVGEGDIPYRARIRTSNLDYSLESLKEVDNYLNILYKNLGSLSDIEYQNVVVWGGAYIGEVIKRNASIEYHWVHYDEYMKDRDVSLKNVIPLLLPTHAFLVAINSKYMTMPMNKVAKWLDEGAANNVQFYAKTDILRKQ